jgi:hypothetical protein
VPLSPWVGDGSDLGFCGLGEIDERRFVFSSHHAKVGEDETVKEEEHEEMGRICLKWPVGPGLV